MSVVDADALGGEDLDATRIPARLSETPSIAVGGAGADVDPDETRERRTNYGAYSPSVSDAPKLHTALEPFIGRVLGNRYRLEQLLGTGGMGVVYRAADLQVPGEVFAIKVLKPKLQGHRELLGALREELRKTK